MKPGNNISRRKFIQRSADRDPQQYFQVPGREIVGVVTAIGNNVIKFRINDRAGHPQVQIISADQINDAWKKVLNKEASYRFVVDAAIF